MTKCFFPRYTGEAMAIHSTTGGTQVQLQGKKVIALGERDGVQGSALAECAKSAGAEVVLETTYCFV